MCIRKEERYQINQREDQIQSKGKKTSNKILWEKSVTLKTGN